MTIDEHDGEDDKMIKTTVTDNGFEGILLEGNGSKDKVMIVMSGSNGGIKLTKQAAEFYHKNGIPALALALFATKGTQPYLDKVPVEYVESAIQWLQKQGYKQIGIDGMSKGSEMALVAASMFSDISCVIVRVPSYFVSEGLIGSGKKKAPSGTSCWSYKGQELVYAPYKTRQFNILKMFIKEKEMHIITFNRDKDITSKSIIPVEKIKAPILILSSKNDSVWPSYESGIYIEKKLEESGFPYQYKHVVYENMSHALITKLPFIYKIAFRAERTNAKACALDRENMKKELLDWVNRVWK